MVFLLWRLIADWEIFVYLHIISKPNHMKKLYILFVAAAAALGAHATSQEVVVDVYDGNFAKVVAQSFNATLTFEDGVYILDNLFNSDNVLKFSLSADLNTYGNRDLTVENVGYASAPYYYIAGTDDGYATVHPVALEGENVPATLNTFCVYGPGSYGELDVAYEGTTYSYAAVCCNGWDPAGNEYSDWLYLYFTWTDLAGVENVLVDGSNAAEYYTLQGVRVANPGNGIYIRRQGAAVTKVIL